MMYMSYMMYMSLSVLDYVYVISMSDKPYVYVLHYAYVLPSCLRCKPFIDFIYAVYAGPTPLLSHGGQVFLICMPYM